MSNITVRKKIIYNNESTLANKLVGKVKCADCPILRQCIKDENLESDCGDIIDKYLIINGENDVYSERT